MKHHFLLQSSTLHYSKIIEGICITVMICCSHGLCRLAFLATLLNVALLPSHATLTCDVVELFCSVPTPKYCYDKKFWWIVSFFYPMERHHHWRNNTNSMFWKYFMLDSYLVFVKIHQKMVWVQFETCQVNETQFFVDDIFCCVLY